MGYTDEEILAWIARPDDVDDRTREDGDVMRQNYEDGDRTTSLTAPPLPPTSPIEQGSPNGDVTPRDASSRVLTRHVANLSDPDVRHRLLTSASCARTSCARG